MKYFLTLFGVALFVIFVFAFKGAETLVDRTVDRLETFENGKPFGKREKGNEDVVDEVRELSSFNSIWASSAIHIELRQGNTQKITVRTDSNLQEHLKTEVENGELKLYIENVRLSTEMTVFITCKELKGIKMTGASDIVSKNKINTKDCDISASGASEVDLEITAEKIKVNESGASTVKLSGNCEDLGVKASGASNVRLYGLLAENVKVLASGSSDVEVQATSSLDATASGASDITYKGNPATIHKKESGGSDISKQ